MALKKKPVNGMKDIMPDEMQIRDYVQSVSRRRIVHSDLLRSRLRVWKTLQT